MAEYWENQVNYKCICDIEKVFAWFEENGFSFIQDYKGEIAFIELPRETNALKLGKDVSNYFANVYKY